MHVRYQVYITEGLGKTYCDRAIVTGLVGDGQLQINYIKVGISLMVLHKLSSLTLTILRLVGNKDILAVAQINQGMKEIDLAAYL